MKELTDENNPPRLMPIRNGDDAMMMIMMIIMMMMIFFCFGRSASLCDPTPSVFRQVPYHFLKLRYDDK